MNNLAFYYLSIGRNYLEAEKWYLMAIEKGNKRALPGLFAYYNRFNLYSSLLKVQIENKVDRKEIINTFNKISQHNLSEAEWQLFLKLLSSFEFANEDNVCVTIRMAKNLYGGKDLIVDL